MKYIGKLHVLTDTTVQSRLSHLEIAMMALKGGADTIQFRQKAGSTMEMIKTASEIKALCKESGVPLIINDRVDVAIAAQADGVHLGRDDFPIHVAKKLLGKEKIIGGSASNIEEALRCLSQGADYIGYGPVYDTTSKEDAGPVKGVSLLKKMVKNIDIPVVAIGGIGAENAAEVMQAGAHGIAVISAVCCSADPEGAVREILRAVRPQG